MTFDRGLSDCFVNALNREYENKDSLWWQSVEDKETFVALRKDEVHVYYLGCRIVRFEWRDGKIIQSTHYKYLLDPDAKQYVEIGKDRRPQTLDNYLIDRVTVKDLKKASAPYAGDEKKGVHWIALRNSNVVDTEVAISTDGTRRIIDLAALQRDEKGCPHVVFYEAKHFVSGSGDLRIEGSGKPKVIEQIGKYRDALRRHRVPIECSYRRVCENLSMLHGVKHHCLPESPCDLIIDDEPGLLVFGFDADQRDGSKWKPHEQKLKANVPSERLILSGDPKYGLSIPKAY